jgi:hypothetical protein
MRKLTIAALLAGQLLAAAQPATAAALTEHRTKQMGAFAGLRLRVPLDGNARPRQVRAGLTVAPTMHTSNGDGETRIRFGEGVEYGLRSGGPLALAIAGQDLAPSRLGAAQDEDEDEDEGGVPTWALIAGGVVVAAGIGVAVFAHLMNESSE